MLSNRKLYNVKGSQAPLRPIPDLGLLRLRIPIYEKKTVRFNGGILDYYFNLCDIPWVFFFFLHFLKLVLLLSLGKVISQS